MRSPAADTTVPTGWDTASPWNQIIGNEFGKDYFHQLQQFISAERQRFQVFPDADDVFHAFDLTPPDEVKILILGQDPYHAPGQAHGLSFSVPNGVKPPPTLVNIFAELRNDVGIDIRESKSSRKYRTGNLTNWAERGVLLLNTVLTVRNGVSHSHRKKGWEQFTDSVIAHLSSCPQRIVFILWGSAAAAKREMIDERVHTVISSVHPSPLSARRGFFGSRPFSLANEALTAAGRQPIDWSLD